MLRFQPPGSSIWIVSSEHGPDTAQFRWGTDVDGRPCNPELHVHSSLRRAEAFRLAVEHEERWRRVLHSYEERRRREEQERRREEEAAARWDEIRSQWERIRSQARQRQEAPRPAFAPAVAMPVAPPAAPACIDLLGLPWPCTADEVKAAYRRRALQLHPDRGGSEAEFIALRNAYEEALELCSKLC
jgi:hypothetical protein